LPKHAVSTLCRPCAIDSFASDSRDLGFTGLRLELRIRERFFLVFRPEKMTGFLDLALEVEGEVLFSHGVMIEQAVCAYVKRGQLAA